MNKIIPVDNEEQEIKIVEDTKPKEIVEEDVPIINLSGRRSTNINDLIEKQNKGLDNLKKMNELADELNKNDNFIKEVTENAYVENNDDIQMVIEKGIEESHKKALETIGVLLEHQDEVYQAMKTDTPKVDVAAEQMKQENPIFDYNAPISDSTFSSPEVEKAIISNLNDTLNSLNKTTSVVKEQTESIKKVLEPKEEIKVIEEKEETEDIYTVEVDTEVETPKVIEEKTEEVKLEFNDKKEDVKPINNDDEFTIEEDKDTSMFTEVKTLKEDDLSLMTEEPTSDIVVPLSDLETITEVIIDSDPASYQEVIRTNPQYRPFVEKLRNVIEDQRSYLHRIHRAGELFYTAQQNFNRNALQAAVNRNGGNSKFLTSSAKIGDQVIKDVMADKESALRKIADGATIKGNKAVQTVVLLTQGIKRVQLFNSGFYIVIRAPKLSELAEYWRESTSAVEEYGRLLGQLSYLPADIQYKRAAMNLLEKLTIDSNFKDFNVPGELRKAISFLDFDTVMWAIVSLMFPKGVQIDYACHNGNCRYVETSKISVKDMRYNDWSLLTSDDILFTSSKDERTLEDLNKYRERIHNKGITRKINDEFSAVFRIPTMSEIESTHLSYLADLTKKTQLNALQDAAMYIAVKYYGLLAPFTEKLTYRSDETGKVLNFESDSLSSILEAIQTSNINFAETVNNFINDTKITHICFTFNKCPSCGNLPTSAIGHLIPCDVQRTFFTWIARRLTELM